MKSTRFYQCNTINHRNSQYYLSAILHEGMERTFTLWESPWPITISLTNPDLISRKIEPTKTEIGDFVSLGGPITDFKSISKILWLITKTCVIVMQYTHNIALQSVTNNVILAQCYNTWNCNSPPIIHHQIHLRNLSFGNNKNCRMPKEEILELSSNHHYK